MAKLWIDRQTKASVVDPAFDLAVMVVVGAGSDLGGAGNGVAAEFESRRQWRAVKTGAGYPVALTLKGAIGTPRVMLSLASRW